MKKVLVSWSGGLDSTYLIQRYLLDGYEVHAVNNIIHNNASKAIMELNAIHKLIPKLEKLGTFKYLDKLCKIDVNNNNPKYKGLIGQSAIWLYSMCFFDFTGYDHIALGYLACELEVSYLEDINNLAQSLQSFMVGSFPPIQFPLKKIRKISIYELILSELLEDVTHCEMSIYDESKGVKVCQKCLKCSNVKGILKTYKDFLTECKKYDILKNNTRSKWIKVSKEALDSYGS